MQIFITNQVFTCRLNCCFWRCTLSILPSILYVCPLFCGGVYLDTLIHCVVIIVHFLSNRGVIIFPNTQILDIVNTQTSQLRRYIVFSRNFSVARSSLLSSTFPEAMVDSFLFGAGYLKFKCELYSVSKMQACFDRLHALMHSHRFSADVDKLRLIMLALERNIRALTVAPDISNLVFILKIQNLCFAELFGILTAHHNNIKLVLLRMPGNINHGEAAAWLTALTDFRMAERMHLHKASDSLHFLRGGTSRWYRTLTRHMSETHLLEQADGRVEPRMQLSSAL